MFSLNLNQIYWKLWVLVYVKLKYWQWLSLSWISSYEDLDLMSNQSSCVLAKSPWSVFAFLCKSLHNLCILIVGVKFESLSFFCLFLFQLWLLWLFLWKLFCFLMYELHFTFPKGREGQKVTNYLSSLLHGCFPYTCLLQDV